MNQWKRLGLEMGPLILFFIANAKAGIFTATAVFMVASVVSVTTLYLLEKKVPVMPLVMGVVILVFGGLTIALDDEMFIKLKPTIVNSLFAAVLLFGYATHRNFLKMAFGMAFSLDDAGWRILTWRWAWFFVFLAVLNEFVWRTQTTDDWVTFKVFGIMPITIAFSIAQLRVIMRHQINVDEQPASAESE